MSASLPAGSQVVVHWRDPQQDEGASATADAPASLHDKARRAFDGRPCTTVAVTATATSFDRWTTDNGIEIVLGAHCPATLAPAARRTWQALARYIVGNSLEALQAQARIASLQKSERLQQALFEIADLAGSGLEMQEMLRRIHAVVGGLMYAENCYIVAVRRCPPEHPLPVLRRPP